MLKIPIAHKEGNYFCDPAALAELERNDQIVFRYVKPDGADAAEDDREANPNGSLHAIAGICNRERNVLGLMPHPERAVESPLGSADGLVIFRSVVASLSRQTLPVNTRNGEFSRFAQNDAADASTQMIDTEIKVTPQVAAEHGLTPDEYARIQKILGRDPNFTELGIFSVMWSEHCSYKSSRVHLKRLPTRGTHVVQGPGENAGVVDIGDGLVAVFKIESHNHPSFVEPFQGAATGVGGILRDIFTMGARPIAVLDSLRFGPITPGPARATRPPKKSRAIAASSMA